MDWHQAEDNVRRLRQRIFTASKAGDLGKVRSLQKLMLRSRSAALVSVRRVTEINAGRKTAGVDGRLVVDDQDKAEMAAWLQHGAAAWTPRPVKRVFIPKAGGKRRGLGIPVIADRCLQALTVGALATPHGSVATMIAFDRAGIPPPPPAGHLRLWLPTAALATLAACTLIWLLGA